MMQLARCRVKIDRDTDVPKVDITPAEALVLLTAHSAAAGGKVITELELTGETGRSDAEELNRLKYNYGNLKHRVGDKDQQTVSTLFARFNKMPQTFEEVGLGKPKEAVDELVTENSEEDQGELPKI